MRQGHRNFGLGCFGGCCSVLGGAVLGVGGTISTAEGATTRTNRTDASAFGVVEHKRAEATVVAGSTVHSAFNKKNHSKVNRENETILNSISTRTSCTSKQVWTACLCHGK